MSNANPLVPLHVRGEAVAPTSDNASRDDSAQPGQPARPTRRQAMQWVMAAVAASALPTKGIARAAATVGNASSAAGTGSAAVKSYGFDPDLMKIYKPGDVWPLTFSNAQHKTAAALADMIIPRDRLGPAASEVGAVEMIDEWISAPYHEQQSDRPVILDGLAWLEAESNQRFKGTFAALSPKQQHAICDDICFTAAAKPKFRKPARFFSKFRDLCAAAYYATPAGWQAIGYVGNIALASFEGPPPEVLERLGVTQTVK
ncbi:MAG TPA: gluconate 2-dehydrogenase subunit 3 family protein [Tepidisphaeraceae bacterium]|nr:gluconate 2-dehydrogenase subunit 3 family protein [Tepidisphaeraceae bacterium]